MGGRGFHNQGRRMERDRGAERREGTPPVGSFSSLRTVIVGKKRKKKIKRHMRPRKKKKKKRRGSI